MKQYTTNDVCEILKLNKNTLLSWLAENLIVPSVKVSPGQGSGHFFNQYDLHYIAVFRKLLKAGIKRKFAKKLMEDNLLMFKDLEESRNKYPTSDNKAFYKFIINVEIDNYGVDK